MIERDIDDSRSTGRIILRPNRSATWRQDLWLLAAIAAVALPLAIGWFVLGFWVILPFAIVHLLIVGWAFYVSSHKLLAREVLTLEDERVVIEAGHRRPERRFELRRPWTEVRLWAAPRHNHPSRLIVRDGGTAVECGRFLTEAERRALRHDLVRLLAHRSRVEPG